MGRPRSDGLSCSYCGRDGHLASECSWPRSGNHKLTAEQVVEIRSMCDERSALEDRLAALQDAHIADVYGVSSQTIRNIRLGYTWADL